METARHRNRDNFIVVRFKDGGELTEAFGVAAFCESDEKLAVDAKDVAALERARQSDVLKFAKLGKDLRERSGFRAAGLSAEGKDDGEFVEDDGGILDKHGVGEIRLRGERNDTSSEFFEKLFVSEMLRTGDFEVYGLARDEA